MDAQLRIKQDSDEYLSYLTDLHQWEAQLKAKDAALAAKEKAEPDSSSPIRWVAACMSYTTSYSGYAQCSKSESSCAKTVLDL